MQASAPRFHGGACHRPYQLPSSPSHCAEAHCRISEAFPKPFRNLSEHIDVPMGLSSPRAERERRQTDAALTHALCNCPRCLKEDAATAAIPVVALTAYAMQGDREKALAAGCDGYSTKPIDTKGFPAVVQQYLASAREQGSRYI
jgi:hypothetical protein